MSVAKLRKEKKKMTYNVIYGPNKKNKDQYHYDVAHSFDELEAIIDWCKLKNLVIISVKLA